MKELFIRMRDEDREVEFTIPEGDRQSSFVALQGVFTFLDIDIDLHNITENYLKTQKLYEEFYKEHPKADYTTTNEKVFLTDDELFERGMKRRNGKVLYRTSYTCSKCGHRGRHYLPDVHAQAFCHKCYDVLLVRYADSEQEEGLPNATEGFIYFTAGKGAIK